VFDQNSAAEYQYLTRGAKKKLSMVTLNTPFFFFFFFEVDSFGCLFDTGDGIDSPGMDC